MEPAGEGFPSARDPMALNARASEALAARGRQRVERRGETAHAGRDPVGADRREPEAEPGARIGRPHEEDVARLDQHAVAPCDHGELRRVDPRRCAHPQRGAALRHREGERRQLGAQGGGCRAEALAHHLVGAARVRGVVAEREEERVGVLQERARVADHRVAQLAQLRDQLARGDDVAQAQRGREAFRHRAHVDDAAGPVEALQRRHRRAGVQVLCLVVVLDDDEVGLLGALEEPLAPLEGERRRGRALVRGRDEGVVERRQRVDDDAVAVDRHRRELRPAQREAVARVRVAGLLEADPGRAVEQRLGEQVERVLRADREQDLVGEREDAARRQQPGPDLLDEIGHVPGLEVRRPVRQLGAREAPDAALAEVVGGEELGVVGSVDERIGLLAPALRLGERRLAAQRAARARAPLRRTAGLARTWLGLRHSRPAGGEPGETRDARRHRLQRDEDAAARPRVEEALVDELRIGRGHGVAADAQLRRELARGGHRRAGAQAPVGDRLHHGAAQARLQRQRCPAAELEEPRPLDRLRHRRASLAQRFEPIWLFAATLRLA